jgi:hypothetical protein
VNFGENTRLKQQNLTKLWENACFRWILDCFGVNPLINELVPKPVVLSQALVGFQPAAYKTTFFIGSCSKI